MRVSAHPCLIELSPGQDSDRWHWKSQCMETCMAGHRPHLQQGSFTSESEENCVGPCLVPTSSIRPTRSGTDPLGSKLEQSTKTRCCAMLLALQALQGTPYLSYLSPRSMSCCRASASGAVHGWVGTQPSNTAYLRRLWKRNSASTECTLTSARQSGGEPMAEQRRAGWPTKPARQTKADPSHT